MKKQIMKRLLTLVLSLALVAVCFATVPTVEVQAADDGEEYLFSVVEYATFQSKIASHTAPEYPGNYLFAGWYQTDRTTPITSVNEVAAGQDVYAKFIKANIRGVAMQAKWDIETADKTDLRIVSVIHGNQYKTAGFNIYVRKVNADTGALETERVLSEYNQATGTSAAAAKKLYKGLNVYSDETTIKETATPSDVFGRGDGWYFYTAKLVNIPQSMYDNNIIVAQPYWVTLDGTYVPGLTEFNRANDGLNKIVNVTVNLMNTEAFAAGGMTISYDTSNFVFKGYDNGRVFESEFTLVNNSGVITAYGNTSLWGNVLDPNNVFVNLRFEKTDSFDAAAGSTVFEVGNLDFANWNEELQTATTVTANAPHVRY